MVTLQTADSALKSFYLDAVTKEINEKGSPFFSMIEKTSANVVGKSVTKVVKTGFGGVGAGAEDGTLPNGDNGEYISFSMPLKNIYGTIEITDKAIRASATNEGAFVNLLNEEMESLVQSAKYNFARMLFGDGSGKLGTMVNRSGSEYQFDRTDSFEPGMCLDIWSGGQIVHSNCKIRSVNRKTGVVEFSSGVGESGITLGSDAYLHGVAPGYELTGLRAIFSGAPLYGQMRTNPYMAPYMEMVNGEIDESIMQRAMDEVERASGSQVDLIICSWGVRRALINALKERNYPITNIKIGDSISAISFNGVPIVVDRFCPTGTMYLLNTKDFKLCQLCDWQWMEGEDGKVLKQVPGKPVYTATLVKYAELICQKPCGQAALTGIIEA